MTDFGLFCLELLASSSVVYSAVSSHTQCHIRRSALLSGFHREIKTEIQIEPPDPGSIQESCEFALLETLPSGMYVDLYQLAMEEEFGGHKVYAADSIDLEEPEYIAAPHDIYVYGKLEWGKNNIAWINSSLPVHLRYHKPQPENSLSSTQILAPLILHTCTAIPSEEEAKAPCSTWPHDVSCLWKTLHCNPSDRSAVLDFSVPVGRTEHQVLVLWITLAITTAAVLILGYVMLHTPLRSHLEDVKQR